jgi:DNA-binding NarL/FixJ family response regulator
VAGGSLRRDVAIRLALGEPAPNTSGAIHLERHGPLSGREMEVARLVADGLSNKEIGARLFISERTVDSHIRHILDKLGFDSRARVARWVSEEPSP